MKNLFKSLMVILLSAGVVWAAGSWSTNNFSYKPQLTTQGTTDRAQFNISQDRVDAKLAQIKELGDPGYEDFATALVTIGATNTNLRIPSTEGAVAITGNTTVPANVNLVVDKGAYFDIADAVTLTINGPIEAGPWQIFSVTGTGSATLSCGTALNIYPEWWGLTTGGSADTSPAIQAALDAAPNGSIIRFQACSYGISTGLTFPTGIRVHLKGSGWRGTTLKALADMTMISLPAAGGEQCISISGMILNGNSKTGTIIDINGTSYVTLYDMLLANMTTGIDLTDTGAYHTSIKRIRFSALSANGILLDNTVNNTNIELCNFHEAMAYGIKTNTTFSGDTLKIIKCEFNQTSVTNNILLQSTSGTQGQTAVIDNCRFDNTPTDAVINSGRYLGSIIRNNSFRCGSPYDIIVDGYACVIDSNYHGPSTTASINLTANSSKCMVLNGRFGTGGEVPASKYVDSGTNNTIQLNWRYGTSAAIASGGVIAHGLGVTPDAIQITAAESGPTDLYATADATNITVTFGGGGNKAFNWSAGAKP